VAGGGALHERELTPKEREGSLLSNAVSDWITKDRRLAEETRQREAALLVKAFEYNNPNVVWAKAEVLAD
jgi:hypothetical protein